MTGRSPSPNEKAEVVSSVVTKAEEVGLSRPGLDPADDEGVVAPISAGDFTGPRNRLALDLLRDMRENPTDRRGG
jgi:hypothetical protein